MLLYYVIIFCISLLVPINFINQELFHSLLSFVWAIATVLIILSGIYFSIKYKFIQFRFIKMIKSLFSKSSEGNSSFEALSLSLSAKLGVGSLSGIALAIYIGGPGTIFWMWLCTLICVINTYVESVLGIKYQEKRKRDLIGGPSFYIKKGLGNSKLAMLYSILIILSYTGLFLTIQSNTIVSSIVYEFNISSIYPLLFLTIISLIVIFMGNKIIAKVSAILVPIMGVIYIFISFYVIIKNITVLPNIIINIFKLSLNFKSISSSLFVIIIGIQRGMFASESGLGTSAISSASCKNDPSKQGLCEVFGVYFTVFIICTMTAILILLSDYSNINFGNINGIELTMYAFKYHLGKFGSYLLTTITILFAYSTIISGYVFGEVNLKALFNKVNKKVLLIFKIITILLIIIGGVMNPSILWNLVDVMVAFLLIINIYSMLKLTK